MKQYYSFFFLADQEIAKSGSKKWKIQEESAHYILWRREGSNKIDKSESESSVSMQGQGFLDKAPRQGYNQTQKRAEWLEVLRRNTSVRLEYEAAEEQAERLGAVRQNIAVQIQLKTKCMVRQNTVDRTKKVKKNSCPLAFNILCNVFDVFCSVFPQQRHDSF